MKFAIVLRQLKWDLLHNWIIPPWKLYKWRNVLFPFLVLFRVTIQRKKYDAWWDLQIGYLLREREIETARPERKRYLMQVLKESPNWEKIYSKNNGTT